MADPKAPPKPQLDNAYTLKADRKSKRVANFKGKGDHDGDGRVGGAKKPKK